MVQLNILPASQLGWRTLAQRGQPAQKKKPLIHRDTLLAGVAKKVSSTFGFHLGATKTRSSEEPPPVCGAVISAAAMFGFDVIVNFARSDAMCRRAKLPIENIVENYVLEPRDLLPITNYLAPTPPDELRADPSQE